MRNTLSKETFNILPIFIMRIIMIVGRIAGKSIFHIVCHLFAPSISQASYNCVSTEESAAIKIILFHAKVCHTPVRTYNGTNADSLPNILVSLETRCIAFKKLPTTPLSFANIILIMDTITTTEIKYGIYTVVCTVFFHFLCYKHEAFKILPEIL